MKVIAYMLVYITYGMLVVNMCACAQAKTLKVFVSHDTRTSLLGELPSVWRHYMPVDLMQASLLVCRTMHDLRIKLYTSLTRVMSDA